MAKKAKAVKSKLLAALAVGHDEDGKVIIGFSDCSNPVEQAVDSATDSGAYGFVLDKVIEIRGKAKVAIAKDKKHPTETLTV